ncbi:hypothetical protein EVAR_54351_1 [Eumeta japonica]|uniref:Uncharacterized protein n=1 Tax=Eumeta variegata TaxID=151549 RepID=A0A4C1Z8A0_EUMVA|nr:hypothetical protein EVAR_54351_1 [Eumeta japonica]
MRAGSETRKEAKDKENSVTLRGRAAGMENMSAEEITMERRARRRRGTREGRLISKVDNRFNVQNLLYVNEYVARLRVDVQPPIDIRNPRALTALSAF